MNLRESLAASPVFSHFSAQELDDLAAAMQVRELADGEVFIREGEPGNTFYFLVDGSVDLSGPGGGSVIAQLGAGSVVGLVALIDHGRRSVTCRASGSATLASLPREAFTLLASGNAGLALSFQLMIARQLASDARRLNEALLEAGTALDSERAKSVSGDLSGDFFLGSR